MNSAPANSDDSTMPLVWIIIVNWNGRDDTIACLSSLRKITYRHHKVLLIDNASTDGSVPAIRRDFPEVEIIANSENRRFAGANNQGIERALAAGADFVLLLNNDTEAAPNFLQEMVRSAMLRRDIGMVGPKISYLHDRLRIWFAGGEIVLWKGRMAHLGLRQLDGAAWDVPREVDYITGCALLVRRECIESAGVLDESYYIYSEDADWCMRARRAGYLCWFAPQAHVWHKVSASSGGGLTPFKAYHKVRSNFLFFRRYALWWHWFTMPWWIAAGFFIETVRLLMNREKGIQVIAALGRAVVDIFRRKAISSDDSQLGRK
jgi:GT2 family glycosyltransferase